mmetsp:Transcript_99009/g.194477  ORF Transcript_99009/g.194477 Transcript_99009/m.194477 type:complete len:134 (-) Transcript_99009:301-702(-)
MMSFHASPVDARKSVMNAFGKCRKFASPLWDSESWLTVENRLTPSMLNSTRNKKATTPTFASFRMDIARDLNSLFKLRKARIFSRRNNRAMRNIRATEATVDTFIPVPINFIDKPKIVAATQVKSKLFQLSFQ